MDQELSHKAAEAMWKDELQREYPDYPPDAPHRVAMRISEYPEQEKIWQSRAEAALTVFYEHTRAQTRERKPPCCADCGADMVPTPGGAWKCTNCGSTSGSV